MSKRIDRPRDDPAAQPPPPAPSENTPQQDSQLVPSPRNKRRVSGPTTSSPTLPAPPVAPVASVASAAPIATIAAPSSNMTEQDAQSSPVQPPAKKSRTNTPWTAAEEQRLKIMREAGNSWAEIAKTFPSRTEGSVKKHWYKDMHYAEFAEDESQALLNAIKEYETNKWKAIGLKVGKPAKACEQYAKENFGNKV